MVYKAEAEIKYNSTEVNYVKVCHIHKFKEIISLTLLSVLFLKNI